MIIDGVNVTADEKIFSKAELKNYVEYTTARLGGKKFSELEVTMADDGKVDVGWLNKIPFERIRRITGYLTGTLDTWNNAKRSEEKERVKHG